MVTNTNNAKERAHIAKNKVDKRALRLQERMKQQHCAALNDTKEMSRPNTTRKKLCLLDQTTNNVGNKEEVFCCKGGQNKETMLVMAGEESKNDTLKVNMNQSGKPGSGSHDENDMNGMMIAQSKKDEVSVLSAPAQSTFMSFDKSVFNSFGKGSSPCRTCSQRECTEFLDWW